VVAISGAAAHCGCAGTTHTCALVGCPENGSAPPTVAARVEASTAAVALGCACQVTCTLRGRSVETTSITTKKSPKYGPALPLLLLLPFDDAC
jgi:hypothetical protein